MPTIDGLSDDLLLAIFDFYVVRHQDLELLLGNKDKIRSWQSLVHVCRRWRSLVFGEPHRLNLRLCCTTRTPVRKTLDVWPALPLLIRGNVSEMLVDNVIAELGLSGRICQIELKIHTTSQIEKLWAVMQVPFPELAILCLTVSVGDLSYVPILPDSFLGGSAPRLRYLYMNNIPFPGLPKLHLSATHLVHLWLINIPHSEYFSPEAMITFLSELTSLESLNFQFESPQSSPDLENQLSPPPTRSILPALTEFWFKGVNEYLEDLLCRIDAPRLYLLSTMFFNDINFNTPELNQFISRTPTLWPCDEACLVFRNHEALVSLQSHPMLSDHHRMVEVKILCQASDWQLSSLAQVCTLSLPAFSTMETLYIYENPHSPPDWKDNIENTKWLDLLLPFTDVKDLYLSKLFSPRIALALQELTGGRITEVLPALQNVLLEGFQPSEPVQEGIAQFISARQLTNRPVAISLWERD